MYRSLIGLVILTPLYDFLALLVPDVPLECRISCHGPVTEVGNYALRMRRMHGTVEHYD